MNMGTDTSFNLKPKYMDNKLSRIATFIESLPNDEAIGDCQSTLLATTMMSMGAGSKNGGGCTNNDSNCKKSSNSGVCKNYNGFCDDSTNGKDCLVSADPAPGPAILNPIPGQPAVP